MMMLFKIAYRELRNSRKSAFVFVLNLCIGLAGFMSLDVIKISVEKYIGENSRNILGADARLEDIVPLDPKIVDKVDKFLGRKNVEESYVNAMIYTAFNPHNPIQNSISFVIFSQNNYPMYGDMQLRNQNGDLVPLSDVEGDLINSPHCWLESGLTDTLQVKIGDYLQIGQMKFRLTHFIEKDPNGGFSDIGDFYPRIYVGYPYFSKAITNTNFTKIAYRKYYKFKDKAYWEAERITQDIQKKCIPADSFITIMPHQRSGENSARLLGFVNDFLGLIALIAQILSTIGVSYLFRSFLVSRYKNIAIYISLGASRSVPYFVYTIQIVILCVIASLGAGILSFFFAPAIRGLLSPFLPPEFRLVFSLSTFFLCGIFSTIGVLAFCFPLLRSISSVEPSMLFRDPTCERRTRTTKLMITRTADFLPAVGTYYFLAVFISRSWFNGSVFFALSMGTLIFVHITGLVLLKGLHFAMRNAKGNLYLANRNLQRNPRSTIALFTAIGMTVSFVIVAPLIRHGMSFQFERRDSSDQPSLFLFDIQPDQVQALEEHLQKQGSPLRNRTPLLRAHITAINGREPFTRSRWDFFRRDAKQNEMDFKDRGIDITYRLGLLESETIFSGKTITTPYDPHTQTASDETPLLEATLAQDFAIRMGIRMWDIMEFSSSGVRFKAKVVGIRRVRWAQMLPAFFVTVQPGFLEEFPQVHIGYLADIIESDKRKIRTQLLEKFPNITALDMHRLSKEMFEIMNKAIFVILLMSVFCITSGCMVLWTMTSRRAMSRYTEICLMKILGAPFRKIQIILLWENFLVSVLASLSGVIVGSGVSYCLLWYFFDGNWQVSWKILSSTLTAGILLCLGVSWISTQHALRKNPIDLLRGS